MTRSAKGSVFPSVAPAWKCLNNHAACLTIHDVIGKPLPTAMFVLLSKSRRRVRPIRSTDCTALSAAPFKPLLFTGEVRDVAAVSNAHASWMTAISACSESPWTITLGCPTYRANAARLRLANGSLLPFFSRGMATICLYTVSMGTRTVTIGASSSVFRKQ